MAQGVVRLMFIKIILRHIFRKIGSGITLLVLFGFIFWLFETFVTGTDTTIQKMVSRLLPFELHYPGVGIIVIIALAYALGLLRKFPWLRDNLTAGRLMNLFTKNFRHSPVVEIEVVPGVYQKGWLQVTREKIRGSDGKLTDFIAFDVSVPNAFNPASGELMRVNPEQIHYVFENDSGQLFLYLVTVGRAGNLWTRKKFKKEDFIPPP